MKASPHVSLEALSRALAPLVVLAALGSVGCRVPMSSGLADFDDRSVAEAAADDSIPSAESVQQALSSAVGSEATEDSEPSASVDDGEAATPARVAAAEAPARAPSAPSDADESDPADAEADDLSRSDG
jgi:hypothetical protein